LLLLLLITISFKLKLFKWNDLPIVTLPFLRKLCRKTSSDISFGHTWSATINGSKFTLKSLKNLALLIFWEELLENPSLKENLWLEEILLISLMRLVLI